MLIASITQLCEADHRGDPAVLSKWLSNKTPEGVRAMMVRSPLLVAEIDGRLAAVGALGGNAVTLNYVSPEYRFRGVSRALLAEMERRLRASGVELVKLNSTRTARSFYLSAGYAPDPAAAGDPDADRCLCKRLA